MFTLFRIINQTACLALAEPQGGEHLTVCCKNTRQDQGRYPAALVVVALK